MSVSPTLGDQLGFVTAPQFPGQISHTPFTLSVDAAQGIGSGISAKDRAHTIQLMAQPTTTFSDFISPGHVFPLRASAGGLLERPGHTEALYDMCRLTGTIAAAAMCEVLGEDGEPLSPRDIAQYPPLAHLPFLTTVDLFWYQVLFQPLNPGVFEKVSSQNIWLLQRGYEQNFCLDTALVECMADQAKTVTQEKPVADLKVVLKGLSQSYQAQGPARFELVVQDFLLNPSVLPKKFERLCDLSQKKGVLGTDNSMSLVVSVLRGTRFVYSTGIASGLISTSFPDWLQTQCFWPEEAPWLREILLFLAV